MNIPPASSEYMYQVLKNEILTLEIKPGEPMSENDLCKRFGVSRTPVRSALQRLRDAGLVTIVPYKGTTASLLNFEEIRQLIYMRVAVESMVLRDFIDVCTPILLALAVLIPYLCFRNLEKQSIVVRLRME